MDKDLLRLVIIITGLLVMAGMVIWSNLENRETRPKRSHYDNDEPDIDEYDDDEYDGDDYNEEVITVGGQEDEFEITPIGSALDEDNFTVSNLESTDKIVDFEESYPPLEEVENYLEADKDERKPEIPSLIQFSVVAPDSGLFNGSQLLPVLDLVGLTFASTGVFERVDENNLVDFTVASMVEPGTIPRDDPESFSCPGLAFFMQPRGLENPKKVFDDFVAILHQVSGLLGGVEWDASREPLTEETIEYYRSILSRA